MTVSPGALGLRTVLLDIEGTTTPLSFVHEVLFPFARAHLASWLRGAEGTADGRRLLESLAREHAGEGHGGETPPAWASERRASEALAYLEWLMDRDRKSPALKEIQGLIWEEGYQRGELRGEVYDDVPRALARWHARGVRAAIYSSGSVLAQRRLFQSTAAGDLTAFLSGYFDTGVGSKRDAASYARIAAALESAAGEILFVSDVTAELEAAAGAGLATALSMRPGNAPQRDAARYRAVHSFDQIP